SNFTKKVNIVKGTRANTARPKAVLSAVKGNKGNAVKIMNKLMEDLLPLEELKFNLFSVSQMCDKKNSVLFSDTECVVLSPDFKLTDKSHVLLKDIENLIDLRVKVIRCDNGTEFKNGVMNQFCEMKGIKREFSVARTPQPNGVAKRKNRILIEVARTMLADSKLPTTFWAEAVNTACYVQNRVLVIKPHNKTPYELFLGRKPALSFMRPFGCPITILNTIDHLGKFDGKADEGFFIGYSTNSKEFRVFNSRTRIVEENMHVQFSENTSNITGSGPNWLFDIDALTNSMNYKPVVTGNQSNGNAGTKACDDAGKARMETESPNVGFKPSRKEEKMDTQDPRKDSEVPSTEELREDQKVNQELDASINSTNNINTASDGNNTNNVNAVNDDEDVGAESDMNNLDAFMPVSPI
ncbi:ribonuclease H-like domain-containing protein, partial [Tanacetum coccineum]